MMSEEYSKFQENQPASTPLVKLVWEENRQQKEKYMEKNELTIGRADDNLIVISDPMASRYHCVVVSNEDGSFVMDLDSGNGTYLNGEKVSVRQDLHHGDKIQIGQMEFNFVARFQEEKVVSDQQSGADQPSGQVVWTEAGSQKIQSVGDQGITFGRSSDNEIAVDDKEASRVHCKINPSPEGFVITDLNSTNGTYVNNERVVGSRVLLDNDKILIGQAVFTFESQIRAGATIITHPPEIQTPKVEEIAPLARVPEAPIPAEISIERPVVEGKVIQIKPEQVVEYPVPSKPRPVVDRGSALIEVIGVNKDYDTPGGTVRVLKSVGLQIFKGEFVGIRGPSGSGKSTLINMITGIDRPTAGDITVAGQSLNKLSENKMARWRGENIGVIFQFFQLLPTLTIVENLMLPMDFCRKWNPKERKERALALLDSVGLADHAFKLPSQLSGGQQQRAAITRALANDPPLIVADEPTGNLDSKTADQIFTLFSELVAQGKTFLMVTHDVELGNRIPRVIEVLDGELYE